jgi:D-alanyl-D-alanine carboxypeptidase
MGFRPGTLVTLDNALKMLMVKSPNDVAITIAEGISGSVEAFANDMNVYAARLGLHESHFVNPNGLPNDDHVSSARDMAMIGRALLRDFPEEHGLFGIGTLAFGRQLINNHNGLLGRYPGVDGMKTGYTCAAGYNVVESAERNGRHLIVVIMGAPSTRERNLRAAALFDRFFAESGQSLGRPESLPSSDVGAPPNMRDTVCGRNRRAAIVEAEAEDAAIPMTAGTGKAALDHPGQAVALGQGAPSVVSSLSPVRTAFEPVRVFIGPVAGWSGRIAQAVGSGSKEINVAPVRTAGTEAVRKPVEQARVADPQPAQGSGGPIEGAAPAPMALLGATAMAPAALATKHLVRSAPSLSLSVGSKKKARASRAAAKAKAVATTEAANPPVASAAKPKGKAPAKQKAATPAAKPAKVSAKAAARPAPAKKQAIFKPGSKPVAAKQ